MSAGEPKRCTDPVTSMNASSIERRSTIGVYDSKIVKTAFEYAE